MVYTIGNLLSCIVYIEAVCPAFPAILNGLQIYKMPDYLKTKSIVAMAGNMRLSCQCAESQRKHSDQRARRTAVHAGLQ